jgi:3-dehydroquinate synthetase
METLTVALGDRSYPIYVGPALLERAELLLPFLRQPKAAIVTNSTVAPLYLQRLADPLRRAGVEVVEIILPDGEQFKDWRTLNAIFDVLLQRRCDRSTTLIALGGGVIGDITGFAAACFQRGVPFIQVPTTVARAGRFIGGWQDGDQPPVGQEHDRRLPSTAACAGRYGHLNTLPDRELRAGLAEVIKYGLIRDLPFLEWLEANLDRPVPARDAAGGYRAICRSCRNKAEVVVADERESGERALLNLGHTFGHAIETGVGYGQWLHGEAVAAGTMMAAELSSQLGWIGPDDVGRVERIFQRAGLPVYGPALAGERYLDLMQNDKKVQDGKLRLVLLQQRSVRRWSLTQPRSRGPYRHCRTLHACLSWHPTPSPRPIHAVAGTLTPSPRIAANSSATGTGLCTPPRSGALNTRPRFSSITKATCSVRA